MPEPAKRLSPLPETLRELFLKSGNLCSYPGCGRLMMNAEGTFVGQVCHIEAAEEGGERFNPRMTNEERRAAANLMLMCYEHHTVTNDVERYTVEVLERYKREHENRFSRPDRAILETLIDWTRLDEPTTVKNLARLNEVLRWGVGEEELKPLIHNLNEYAQRLRVVPVDIRKFVGVVALRIRRIADTSAVERGYFGDDNILMSDLRGALRLDENTIVQRANELSAYRIGSLGEMFRNDMPHPAVRLNALDGWPLWSDLAQFCEEAGESIDAFSVDLDFRRLDG